MSHTQVHYVRPSRRLLGAEFGRQELREVAVSSLALTVIFATGFAGGLAAGSNFLPLTYRLLLAASLASVPPSFIALAMQKRVGAKQGCTLEFRLDRRWTVLSLALAGFFGAPLGITGRLDRFGYLNRASAGRMAAAGPLAYLAIASTALLLVASARAPLGPSWEFTLRVVAQVDAWLSVLSLLPFPFFAGADVWRWSKVLGIAMGASGVAIFFLAGVV